MRLRALIALAVLVLSWPAQAQVFPSIPPNTFLGRMGAGQAGPPQPLPFGAVGSFLAAQGVPITGLSDPNFASNCGGLANPVSIPTLNENWCLNANFMWLRSVDATIYPGQFNIGGTWASNDVAAVRIAYGSTTLNYSCVVGSTGPTGCGSGTSTQTIANALRALLAADTANLSSKLIFVQPVGLVSAGVYEFQIVPQYSQYPMTLSNQSTSASGTITAALQPANLLADPLGYFCSRDVVGRTPQNNDLICDNTEAWGQIDSTASTQLYTRIQSYIDTVGTVGRFQFQTLDPTLNGVQNRQQIRLGLCLFDASGNLPTDCDKGAGWLDLPVAGGLDLSGAGTITQNGSGQFQVTALGTNALNLITSNSAANISLSPNGSTISTVTPNGVDLIDGRFYPNADSTTAIRLQNHAQSSTILDVDTTNKRIGINKTPGAFDLDVNGAANVGGGLTVLSAFTATGLVTNADLVNAATTVAGATCTLGSTCGLSSFSNALGADVNLNNASNFFDGPTVAQGSTGTWDVRGGVALLDTSSGTYTCKLWDGTTVIEAQSIGGSANVQTYLSLGGLITSPAGNLKISCNDTNTTGKIVHTTSSSNSAVIKAIRIN